MIKITAAAPADINALYAIEQQIFASGEDWQLSRRVFSYHLRRGNFLITARVTARENERQATSIVGYALLLTRQHSARLYALGVLPNFSRRGIGEKLLIAAITEAKRQKKKTDLSGGARAKFRRANPLQKTRFFRRQNAESLLSTRY